MTTLLINVRGQLLCARNLFLLTFLFHSFFLKAQVNIYSFSESTGTYNELVGGTLSSAVGDDGTQFNIALPFTFNFGGNNFTAVGVGTNGWLRLGTSTSIGTFGAFTNSLAAPGNNINFVAPLWDDLNLTGGSISYQTQGTAPNQIFIMEWKNVRWAGSTAPQQNFQVWLYETTNVVEIRYGAMQNGTTASASIGLVGPVAGDFISITPASPATASTSTANNNISLATFLTNGLIYKFTPPACPSPGGLQASNATSASVDLLWNSSATTFNVEYGIAPLTAGTGTLLQNVTLNPFTLSGLNPSTNYQAYVYADCGVDGISNPSAVVSFSTTQVPVTVFPYTEDWETGGTAWTFVNGSQTNKWAVGTATNNGGTQALYVSNDNGVSNAYSTGSASVTHAYRDISFTSGFAQINLSFDWRCVGELTAFDRLRVYLVPTSFVPVAGTQITTTGTVPTGRVQLGLTNYNGQATYTTANVSIPAAYAGQTARLVFEWRNDGSDGSQPPAAVDNVNITLSNCAPPTNLTSSNLTSSSITINWVSSEPAFELEYGVTPLTLGSGTLIQNITTNSATLNNLQPNTSYQFFIRSDCGGQFSPWDGPFQFRTAADNNNPVCLGATEVTIPDNGCGTNNYRFFSVEVSGLVGAQLGTNVFLDKVDLVFSHTYGILILMHFLFHLTM
jgi:hypothetical protein